MQGPLTQWVTDHRKHHALSDKDGDPHSPHVGHGDGCLGALRGLRPRARRLAVHDSRGWSAAASTARTCTTTGSSARSTACTWSGSCSRFGIPFAIGYAIGGTWQAGLEGLVWGGLLRIFLYQHATFSVNSICHMFGRQDYRARDESRNNWLVAAARLRRGLAQQPPRLPVLGAARPRTASRSTSPGG